MVRVRRGDLLVDESLDGLVHLCYELYSAHTRSLPKAPGTAHVDRVELLVVAGLRREPLRLTLPDHFARLELISHRSPGLIREERSKPVNVVDDSRLGQA